MEIKGCKEGYIYLSAYFRQEMEYVRKGLGNKEAREYAVRRTRGLVKAIRLMEKIYCPFLRCSECPRQLLFDRLNEIDVYRKKDIFER